MKKNRPSHIPTELEAIFQKGSKTYFNSSLFFPPAVRDKVIRLYAFVRIADNYVDAVPQQRDEFQEFKTDYESMLRSPDFIPEKPLHQTVIREYIRLFGGDHGKWNSWTRAFLESMEMDLTKKEYNSLRETKDYIYGSAEVIGLFMASIMDLDPKSHVYARALGRAMQYINFIRDIEEDNLLGRRYLPLWNTTLPSLREKDVENQPQEFQDYLRREIRRYFKWQKIAEKGYAHIPSRYLVPIKTAADMYAYTARRIQKNPMIVYSRKVKPSKIRIFGSVFYNFLRNFF